MNQYVTAVLVPESRRLSTAATLFGVCFPLQLEPAIYRFAGFLSDDYRGGYWHFYTLSNGGFYMAPAGERRFAVSAENGYEGELSGDALGVSACLYAYSHLSFREGNFGESCAEHYHRLREFVLLGHPEAAAILAAID
ncbi:MAG: antirestriction protein [Candidatus Accumulibacter sp.]|uniref:Antirestriction protein n=1 Tax=Candidatus Accumulibacter proximus TaxID=2954385 RepID=A0A935UHT3_9PROT|nr:antirestriction protein [Candidatus Accumulibacter proximus]